MVGVMTSAASVVAVCGDDLVEEGVERIGYWQSFFFLEHDGCRYLDHGYGGL